MIGRGVSEPLVRRKSCVSLRPRDRASFSLPARRTRHPALNLQPRLGGV